MLSRLQNIVFIIFILFAGNAFALPITHHQELWVYGKIQNQAYVNWGNEMQFKAYHSTALPAGFIQLFKNSGEFRISTQANTQQSFDLDYLVTTTVDAYGPLLNYDQALCHFMLQVNTQGVAKLSVKTLDNSYVQCSTSQDASGEWIITLTNPAEIS